MIDRSNPARSKATPSQLLLRASIIAGFAALFLVQLLVTFRGLSSPAAMEQAQMAREIARGEGLSTKMIRPFALRQQMEAGKTVEVDQMPETKQPPLPSLLMAPIFKGLEVHWENTAETRVYVLDRVVAALSLLFFIGAMGLTLLTAQRLFDQRIANWTVITMAACSLLWDLATTALAPMMLLFFFSAIMFLLVLMIERHVDQRSNNILSALGIGVLAVLMVFTNWMAIWLLPGLTIAVALLVRPRGFLILVLLPTAAALTFWGMRNYQLTGDVLGAAKSTFQAILIGQPEVASQRSFSTVQSAIDPEALTRHFLQQTVIQINNLYQNLGAALAAIIFFLALLHPFKRQETLSARGALVLMWLGVFIGTGLAGSNQAETSERQLHFLFVPLFSAYGLAFLFVLWARIPAGQGNGWVARHSIAAIATAITALPMLQLLPPAISAGIRNKGMMAQWPPYLPERLALLKPMVGENEVLVSDMPWAIAWYSDRPCIWLPRDPAQLEEIRTLATSRQKSVAGLVLTPWSTRGDAINSGLTNEYEPWAPQIYYGTGQWHGVDTMAQQTAFPFRRFFPLHGRFGTGGRLILEMVFMTDRARWETTEPNPD
ncbi:hypothetical protein FEM03_12160 [Phragmitibacter flavus]|uniref:Glycosyltransferase family 39 protein n=1 Tax=Phragmitibacter flavus TaxID=2576071 RepID=A0A5R8KDU7_9BACT|nr:hypothetical protein [Phragmitibacter flavus]TLD70476.1 hypothetical protein FEM03_12160 [Phragmitibacter flavus]